jgi:uncharacterized protein (DUF1015 family)
MADVRPFRALRPRDDLAARVIAPPYDVLTEAECRALAVDWMHFIHVTRSEVDLPPGTDSHAPVAWERARQTLHEFTAQGVLVEDDAPHYYLYGQVMDAHAQVCVLATVSVAEYDDGRIAKHEFTRPDKEEDRAHHMEVLGAQVGLVFLAHAPDAAVAAVVREVTATAPHWRVTTEDAVEHALWTVPGDRADVLRAAFAAMPRLYICDGHHRSAAASRVAARRKDAASSFFVAGLFPSDALQVLAYNRVVHDLNGLTSEGFLAALGRSWHVIENGPPVPQQRGDVSLLLDGRWRTIRPRAGVVDPTDAVARLDASVLQDHLLGPILGIDDPRRSQRISFVGGIRGPQALQDAVRDGAAVAFHLYPTGLDQLFAVADAGSVMPPKSTWFEPKLREGVVARWLR